MHPYRTSSVDLPPDRVGEAIIVTNLELLSKALMPLIRHELNTQLPEVLRRASMPPRMLKKDAAEFTGMSQRQLDTLRQNNKLRSYKVGRKVWFDTQDLLDYIDSGFLPARLQKRRS